MQYLFTSQELAAASVADLGSMDVGTYATFTQRAQAAAAQAGIDRPKLMLDIKFIPGAHPMGLDEMPYPISDSEWDAFRVDARTMCVQMPHVHVVDGSLYTAAI